MKSGGFVVLLIVVLFMCGASTWSYRPTVDTAVARTYDNVDKVVDTAVAPKPLEDTMALHNQITGGNSRTWLAFAVFFLLITAVVVVFTFIYLRTKQVQATTKRMRAERSLTKNNPLPASSPEAWVTNVSTPPELPPASRAPQARLSLPINTHPNEGDERWTR